MKKLLIISSLITALSVSVCSMDNNTSVIPTLKSSED